MSAPKMDVLAYFDGLIAASELLDRAAGIGPSDATQKARAARAALAELINATRRALAYSDHICDTEHNGKRSPQAKEHYNRMQAALALIGGAA